MGILAGTPSSADTFTLAEKSSSAFSHEERTMIPETSKVGVSFLTNAFKQFANKTVMDPTTPSSSCPPRPPPFGRQFAVFESRSSDEGRRFDGALVPLARPVASVVAGIDPTMIR